MIIHVFFFFNDTATTEIYTLSLHDALPIYEVETQQAAQPEPNHFRRPHFCVIFGIINTETAVRRVIIAIRKPFVDSRRSEEHTSELQSHLNLVCRLLLEKKHLSSSIVVLHI